MRFASFVLMACLAWPVLAEEAGTKETKTYTLTVATEPAAISKDQAGSFRVTIVPKSPWVLKVETPLSIDLKASTGIKLQKARLTAKDILDPKAAAKSLQATFASSDEGEQNISADLSFFLCTEEICQRQKDQIALSFRVQ